MIIGACVIDLYLPGVASLKEKRRWLKPLLAKLRQKFQLAVAEIEYHDIWQSSRIAIVSVANDTRHVYSVLEHAVHWIETEYRGVQLVDWQIELR
ncbi:MAG: DUF503 domain-containing protein [Chloroflexota bacterium]|nr:DUF503 domain-containing protein [Chloroflexota bacterium]